MSENEKAGAVRPKRNKSDQNESTSLAASHKRKKDVAEAETRGTQSPLRLLFAFLIPVLLLIAYAVFGG